MNSTFKPLQEDVTAPTPQTHQARLAVQTSSRLKPAEPVRYVGSAEPIDSSDEIKELTGPAYAADPLVQSIPKAVDEKGPNHPATTLADCQH